MPASIKEAAIGRLPQGGRAAPQPAAFAGAELQTFQETEKGVLKGCNKKTMKYNAKSGEIHTPNPTPPHAHPPPGPVRGRPRHGVGWDDINIHVDININIEFHVIINNSQYVCL